MLRCHRLTLLWWAALAFGAGSVFPQPGTAAGPSALIYALISTGTSKIPAFTTTGEDTQIINQIYGALLEVEPRTFKIGPSLATGYAVSEDGKTWTLKLRRGARWQRGFGEFTCADVKFTWDFNRDPANHYSAVTSADRDRALREVQRRLAADVPAIELWQQNDLWLVNERVQRYEPTVLFNGDPLERVTLKTP